MRANLAHRSKSRIRKGLAAFGRTQRPHASRPHDPELGLEMSRLETAGIVSDGVRVDTQTENRSSERSSVRMIEDDSVSP